MADAVENAQAEPARPIPPLSEIHKMLPLVRRDFSAHEINRFANHPDIVEWVRGHELGRLDLTNVVAQQKNVCLVGEYGVLLFCQLQPGVYEVHTLVAPEGRGPWAAQMARTCLHLMFTASDALEIVTRVPRGNLGARTLALMCGFEKEFTQPAAHFGWVYKGDPVPSDILSLTIQKWMRAAPGLVERGQWFHKRLEDEYARFGKTEPPHADDLVHDRYVGAAVEMIFGGNALKAITFYNRWASLAGYEPAAVASLRPLTIDIRAALLCFRNNDFWVMSCR